MTKQIQLARTKETKNTVVFTTDADVAITAVYVRKGHGFDDAPSITLTIQASDDSLVGRVAIPAA